jgi:arylsulfatase A
MKGRKGSLHEGGSRVPCFLRWTGRIPAETVIPQIAAHIDLLPTLAELTGVALPTDLELDGISQVPWLTGPAPPPAERTLFTQWGDNRQTRTPDPRRAAVRTSRWRAVRQRGPWQLFDMQSDPEQRHDLSRRYPDVVGTLSGRFDQWFEEVTRSGFDPIATEVGHDASPVVTLPGHEAFLHPAQGQGIDYRGRSGWAHDWITRWSDPEAYPGWPIDVVRAARYEVRLLYCAPARCVGDRVQVRIGDSSLEAVISEAHDPPDIPSPDRIARGEVYERRWAELALGAVALQEGPADVQVRALHIASETLFDLKAVQLRRVDE